MTTAARHSAPPASPPQGSAWRPRPSRPSSPVPRPRLARDGFWPWLFVGPLMLGVSVFYLWPIVQTAWMSLTDTGPFGGSTFSGVQNYLELFVDPQLYLSLANTLLYTAIVLLGIPIAVYISSSTTRAVRVI